MGRWPSGNAGDARRRSLPDTGLTRLHGPGAPCAPPGVREGPLEARLLAGLAGLQGVVRRPRLVGRRGEPIRLVRRLTASQAEASKEGA